MQEASRRLLISAVDGDSSALAELSRLDKAELHELAATTPPLVRGETVAKLLAAQLAGELSMADTQAWAAFVRWGDVGGSLTNIHLEYESACEEAIVRAVARMDELGDLVDGEISMDEGKALIATLASSWG